MISHLDHLVLTTANKAQCVRFYTKVLGMTLESFIGGTPPVECKALLHTGATSKIRSIYLRDPDLDQIEISEPVGTP